MTVKKSKLTGIFIHSLFKTGSTYIWYKFRQLENTHCFYERFHHQLLRINKNYETEFKKDFYLNRSSARIEPHYLKEYEGLIQKDAIGLPYLQKEFVLDSFCETNTIPGLKKYISSLFKCAGQKLSILQFNRTALRTKWFKHKYPDFLNIYLLRNPRDQFNSYINSYNNRSRIFNAIDLLVASKNTDYKIFSVLSEYIELYNFEDINIENEIKFYSLISEAYSVIEKYIIFFFIWFAALLENIQAADLIIDLNELSNNSEYRNEIENNLVNLGSEKITFSDAKINQYDDELLKEYRLDLIEDQIKYQIMQSFDIQLDDLEDNNLVAPFIKYFKIQSTFSRAKMNIQNSEEKKSTTKKEQIADILFKNSLSERQGKLSYMQKYVECEKRYRKFKIFDRILERLG